MNKDKLIQELEAIKEQAYYCVKSDPGSEKSFDELNSMINATIDLIKQHEPWPTKTKL